MDWFDEGGGVEWRPGATLRVVAAWAYTCGWPPRNKGTDVSPSEDAIRATKGQYGLCLDQLGCTDSPRLDRWW